MRNLVEDLLIEADETGKQRRGQVGSQEIGRRKEEVAGEPRQEREGDSGRSGLGRRGCFGLAPLLFAFAVDLRRGVSRSSSQGPRHFGNRRREDLLELLKAVGDLALNAEEAREALPQLDKEAVVEEWAVAELAIDGLIGSGRCGRDRRVEKCDKGR